MSYGKFKSIEEVARKFDIEVANKSAFFDEIELIIPDILFSMVKKNLSDKTSYVSEHAICDAIIRPILGIVVEDYPLKVWSHVPYDVDKDNGLTGEPDYLIAARNKYGGMARPSLCVIEAKKDNFDEGWTQALAEMVASHSLGADICYSIVTTGDFWQFGKLENHVFIVDSRSLAATTELQTVLNTINWLFKKISLEQLLTK